MPNHIYRGKEPPAARDHLYAHPFETLLSGGTLIACALIVASELGAPLALSDNIVSLPAFVAWLVALTGIGGHALILAGLYDAGADLHRGWRLERLGIVGAVTSWGTYATAIALLAPASVISYILPALVALAYAVRFLATVREDQATRASIRATLPPAVRDE